MTVSIVPRREWACPNCSAVDVTHEARPHTRYHTCAGLKGLSAPMVPAGTKVKVSTVERQDYIGNEKVQTDSEGRPVMAVITERADGSNDVTVLAPTATARVKEP